MQSDLILVGIQGSGKGTQAKLLEARYGFLRFETGGALRAISAEDSELGRSVKNKIDNGILVDNETIMDIVADWLSKQDLSKPIMFDGVPRFEEQRQTLEALLEKNGRTFKVLHLEIPDKMSFDRLMARAEIEGRADDNPEAIKKRIQLFHDETKPLLSGWSQRDLVITVDGTGEIEQVTARIVSALDLSS